MNKSKSTFEVILWGSEKFQRRLSEFLKKYWKKAFKKLKKALVRESCNLDEEEYIQNDEYWYQFSINSLNFIWNDFHIISWSLFTNLNDFPEDEISFCAHLLIGIIFFSCHFIFVNMSNVYFSDIRKLLSFSWTLL